MSQKETTVSQIKIDVLVRGTARPTAAHMMCYSTSDVSTYVQVNEATVCRVKMVQCSSRTSFTPRVPAGSWRQPPCIYSAETGSVGPRSNSQPTVHIIPILCRRSSSLVRALRPGAGQRKCVLSTATRCTQWQMFHCILADPSFRITNFLLENVTISSYCTV